MFTNILAIETSCDETSAAVMKGNKVLSNIISSQYFHKEYGGIVPELASRAHIQIIDKIVTSAITSSGVDKQKIEIAAATAGPGLIGSLLVGYNYAKGFALAGNIPFIPVNHIESHLFSCFIGKENIDFPFISLVVSGGHTILFHVKGINNYTILGETQDDAAGEAFDKAAKMLGLQYPGGPEIEKHAADGNENFHKFPIAYLKENIYDFSFSGIKTSLLYFLRKHYPEKNNLPLADICASFQKAVVSSLVEKTILAAKNLGINTIAVSGGVSANTRLRTEFMKYENQTSDTNVAQAGAWATGKETGSFNIFFPEKKYSTDNAAMIGYLAYLKLKESTVPLSNNDILAESFARFKH